MAATPVAPTARPPWRHSLRTRIALWFGVLAAAVAAAGGIAIHAVAERRALEDERRCDRQVGGHCQQVGLHGGEDHGA